MGPVNGTGGRLQLPVVAAMREMTPREFVHGPVRGLTSYGAWCGGGHGGYQDCCDGGPCPACDPSAPGMAEECLAQCPPLDALDMQCAFHDHCTFSQDYSASISCHPQGNFCACDCILANRAELVTCDTGSCSEFRTALYSLFEHALACVYVTRGGGLACDGLISGRYSLDEFCPAGRLRPYDSACVPDNSPRNAFCDQGKYSCYDGFHVDPSRGVCTRADGFAAKIRGAVLEG
jgi:hypothetical protein